MLPQEAGNADVQVALGVLRSLARQYDAAGEAFRLAAALCQHTSGCPRALHLAHACPISDISLIWL